MRHPHLYEQANCVGTDPDAYWPEGNTGGLAGVETALRVCGNCVHRQECLEWALHYEPDGIWGGTSAHARKRLRSQMGITLRAAELLPSFYARVS